MTTSVDGAGSTVRLTVGQAIVRFLEAQVVERDGHEEQFFGGALAILGHGSVGGIGQALLEDAGRFKVIQGRNEQGMGHIATGYAKMKNRLGAMAVSTSIGPGAANLVTAAGVATVNRLPLLLLPSDYFATRRTGAVLQQIENEQSADISTNDAFRAVSRYWDRIYRPEQLAAALLNAMGTLLDPANTGAVTLCLPQDVQGEAYDFPAALLQRRVWRVPRARPDVAALEDAAAAINAAKAPVIIAGGGVVYSEATEQLAQFVDQTGIPVGITQAGKGSIAYDHPLALGALGYSGLQSANAAARDADLVIGIGTRYTDFTSASNTMFRNPDVRFVNINVCTFDAFKESAIPVVGDARVTLQELGERLVGWSVNGAYRTQMTKLADASRSEVQRLISPDPDAEMLGQEEVIGIVNELAGPKDVVVNAAGSMPGDLHRLWKVGSPLGYGMEYGYSCMGYEIPASLGMRIADNSREIFTFIGDASFLMYHQDLLTAVQEGEKIIVLLLDNDGYGSIGSLSEEVGSQRFECNRNLRGPDGKQSGPLLPVNFPKLIEAYGVQCRKASTAAELREAVQQAIAATRTTAIYVPVSLASRFDSDAFWDVQTPEVATVESSIEANKRFGSKRDQELLYL